MYYLFIYFIFFLNLFHVLRPGANSHCLLFEKYMTVEIRIYEMKTFPYRLQLMSDK